MIIAGWILTPEILKAGLGEATQISHSLTIAAAVYPLEGKCVAVKKKYLKRPSKHYDRLCGVLVFGMMDFYPHFATCGSLV